MPSQSDAFQPDQRRGIFLSSLSLFRLSSSLLPFWMIIIIIMVVLTKVNFAAMERLKEHGLTIENLLNTSEEKLGELIKPVGFWRRKAQWVNLMRRISLFNTFAGFHCHEGFSFQSHGRYLLEVAAVLRDQYGGDIPDSVEGLCKLKGVGVRNDSANLFTLLPGGTQDGALVHEQWLGQAIGYWGGCPCAQVCCNQEIKYQTSNLVSG